MLESGTASGFSAELMGRFFKYTGEGPVNFYTIDSDALNYETRSGALTTAATRLKGLPVKLMHGNSKRMIPTLIKKHAGKRIGIFIDGPKRKTAIELCRASLLKSEDVQYCAIHDAGPCQRNPIDRIMTSWSRSAVNTWLPYWYDRFSPLDKNVGNNMEHDCSQKGGFGVAILIGRGIVPWGEAEGDASIKNITHGISSVLESSLEERSDVTS